jgi:HAD superfamily hydrolase (TIGR01509 family)
MTPPVERRAETCLVILDFDGVVADSEIIALAELQTGFAACGMAMTWDEIVARFLGTSTADIMAFVDAHAGEGAGRRLKDEWYRRLFARYAEELRIMPNAIALLDRLDRLGMRYCVASGGTRERLAFGLQRIGLTERFAGAAFSAEAVAQGKPAPDLFLLAAREMGTSPQTCLVVEDAVAGVEAAARAGMPALGFVGGRHLDPCRPAQTRRLRAAGALAVLDDLLEVSHQLNGEAG